MNKIIHYLTIDTKAVYYEWILWKELVQDHEFDRVCERKIPNLWDMVERSIIVNILVELHSLTDKVKICGNDIMTYRKLKTIPDLDADCLKMIDELIQFNARISPMRNNVFSHKNLSVNTNETDLKLGSCNLGDEPL